ncbi:MAG: NAD-dependent epimerase/dehydratase family protein [Clostridia bacterium]|nr:NAD-dependent epimerase/dehydratase family protein [Clostridia bacterium]
MKKVLVTGGTVFVSRYIAEYYTAKGCEVYVLNRNTRPQSAGVKLIEADRHALGETLRDIRFDVVIDTAYTGQDVEMLLNALGSFGDYILISSSAVYPETTPQPFKEDAPLAVNKFWGAYGTNKIDAENELLSRVPHAYVVRPPYLYGPMNNVYREAFVFDCALANRKFYLPQDGSMQLQFFHVEDLCRFMDILLEKRPAQHIFNVGNKESVSIRDWVTLCYKAVGAPLEFINVPADIEQRSYFSFYNYEYALDVSAQCALMPETKPLAEGLAEALAWYRDNANLVNKKPLLDFIDHNLS